MSTIIVEKIICVADLSIGDIGKFVKKGCCGKVELEHIRIILERIWDPKCFLTHYILDKLSAGLQNVGIAGTGGRGKQSDLKGRTVYFLHIPIHFCGVGEAKYILHP